MYLLNIKGNTPTELITKVFEGLDTYKKRNDIIINYEIDFSSNNILKILSKVDSASLKKSSIISSENTEDIILDLIESKKPLVIINDTLPDNGNNTRDRDISEFHDISNEFGLSYTVANEDGFIVPGSLCELTSFDHDIISEVFEENMVHKQFYPGNFILKYTLDKNGIIRNQFNEDKVYLSEENIINLFLRHTNKEVELVLNSSTIPQILEGFNVCLSTPAVYLINSNNITKDIVDYKFKIFDLIKNISPYDYQKLDKEFVRFLNSKQYMQLDTVKKVLGIS